MATQFIGMGADDFVKGGLLSDVDVMVKTISFLGWDYNGSIQDEVLAVKMELAGLDEKGKEITDQSLHEQFFSCGPKLTEVTVSNDGYRLMPGSKSALTQNSNWHIMLTSLWGLGMPKDFLSDGDLSKLINLKFHCIRVPAPKREGLQGSVGRNADREKEVLIANKIITPTWKAKAGTTKPPANAQAPTPAPAQVTQTPAPQTNGAAAAQPVAPAPAPATSDTTGDDVNGIAAESIKTVLRTNPVMEKLADIKVEVFRLHQNNTSADKRNRIVQAANNLLKSEEWLITNGVNVTDKGITLSE